MTSPSTVTRPVRMYSSQLRRESTPAIARNFCNRISSGDFTLSGVTSSTAATAPERTPRASGTLNAGRLRLIEARGPRSDFSLGPLETPREGRSTGLRLAGLRLALSVPD